MNYGEIKNYDIANGEGVRVSLFVSGCTHRCKGCFNSDTWDFSYGSPYTSETENNIINMLRPNYINGLSLLGGEPMEPENQRILVKLLRRVKKEFPKKDIWCYTGYTFEELIGVGRARCECTDEFLSYIDVLVDGKFILERKNISLAFRGSENQRIIDIPQTFLNGKVILKQLKSDLI